jgi:L-alanine-DL-glutamate epimerase-like enolase superfamily enzyme
MKITGIDCHVLSDPDPDISATSSAQDDIVVEIHTDEGLVGVGETDVNPWIGQACIEAPGTHSMGQSLTSMLLGEDPRDVEQLWEKLYVGSAMNGRRGAVIHAIGALDMALHDLRGKIAGVPTHQLLGEQVRDSVTPYASLQPETHDFDAYHESIVEWIITARDRGFRAAKASLTLSGPYAHRGLREPWSRATRVIEDMRRAVGDDFVLMIDVQYAFADADECLSVLKDWSEFGLYFVETPLPVDDLAGLHRVATEQPIPIATGEWLSTRHEFTPLIESGSLQVAQPDIGRVGGLTEALRVARMAAAHDLTVVPHLWNTGISVAAAVHFAVVTANCPFVEYLPRDLSESPLRKELLSQEPEMVDGVIPLPTAPGLGIEIDRDALERFKEAARRLSERQSA